MFNRTKSEPWFIVTNISILLCLSSSILLAFIFLLIVLFNKTCRRISILHTCNTCLGIIVNGLNLIWADLFRLENDSKQRYYQDIFCSFRGYLGYVGIALLLYSFAFQAIFRFILVVYPTYIHWRSARLQFIFICCLWIFCILIHLPWLLTGDMIYHVDFQACLLPFRWSIPIVYNVLLAYLVPFSSIAFIYFRLVQYIRQMSSRSIVSVQRLVRARRELVMIRRIIIVINILIVLGLPYTIFTILSFLIQPPRYHYRLSILFIDISQTLIMIVLFKFTQPVLDVLIKFKRKSLNRIYPNINNT